MHERDIIHRDYKPQNIGVKEGIIKIIDFDIAKITENS